MAILFFAFNLETASLSHWNPQLDQQIEETLENAGIPGAAITITEGKQAAIKVYGVRDVDSPSPVTAETAFDLGSCSKSFVATAVAMLVSDGVISFDDPIQRYIPEISLDEDWITQQISIRDLLCNRTGLKRQLPIESFANTDIRIPEILKRIGKLDRVHPFRGGYVYFNPGFMANSLVVERVSRMPYEEFLEQRLFKPLGMNHSASGLSALKKLANRAQGHSEVDGKSIPLQLPIFDNWQGAGGVYASAVDTLAWLQFHLQKGYSHGQQLIKPEVLAEIYKAHTIIPYNESKLIHRPPEANFCHYGMGWWSTELHGQRLVQHAGENCGWRAQTALLPDKEIGVAVMLNSTKGRHQALTYSILETLITGKSRDWCTVAQEKEEQQASDTKALMKQFFPCVTGQASAIKLSDFTGLYSHPACGKVEVFVKGNELEAHLHDGTLWDMRLAHLGGNTFECNFIRTAVRDYMPTPLRVRFEIQNGRATQLQTADAVYTRVE